MFHDCQTEAEAAVGTIARAVGLPEAVEHARQDVRRDAGAFIADTDDGVVFLRRDGDRDRSALMAELYGVGQEIPDDLLQAVRIGSDRERCRGLDLDSDP